jgi:hypothetical protein
MVVEFVSAGSAVSVGRDGWGECERERTFWRRLLRFLAKLVPAKADPGPASGGAGLKTRGIGGMVWYGMEWDVVVQTTKIDDSVVLRNSIAIVIVEYRIVVVSAGVLSDPGLRYQRLFVVRVLLFVKFKISEESTQTIYNRLHDSQGGDSTMTITTAAATSSDYVCEMYKSLQPMRLAWTS